MSRSVEEELRRDLECEDLLECVHGLTALDRACFEALATADDPQTIDELADQVDRERSTAYRSVHRLLEADFVVKDQVNYEHGGYYHVYRPADPDAVADEMAHLVEEWSQTMTDLIGQFRREYGDRVTPEPAVE